MLSVCSHPEDGLRCRQGVKPPLSHSPNPELFCRATSNKKLRETVALELSYVNSNLQLLKEELADLNSSVLIYQNDRYGPRPPPNTTSGSNTVREPIFWLLLSSDDALKLYGVSLLISSYILVAFWRTIFINTQ